MRDIASVANLNARQCFRQMAIDKVNRSFAPKP